MDVTEEKIMLCRILCNKTVHDLLFHLFYLPLQIFPYGNVLSIFSYIQIFLKTKFFWSRGAYTQHIYTPSNFYNLNTIQVNLRGQCGKIYLAEILFSRCVCYYS